MAYETINISEDAYLNLLALKKKNESFSDLFLRITKKEKSKPKLSDFYGKWKMSDKEEENTLKDINALWGAWKIE